MKLSSDGARDHDERNLDSNDFISSLPDKILCDILSLLPFESAVTTSFLSTRWKDLWKKSLIDSMDDDDATFDNAARKILSFLNDFAQHHRPRNKWGFQIDFGRGRFLLAAIAPNNTLHLDFSAWREEFRRPFDLLLKFNRPSRDHWPFPYHSDMLWDPNPPFPSPCDQLTSYIFNIETLYLKSVSCLSSKALAYIVSKIPFLDSLIIAKCRGLQSLDIGDATGIRNLTILDCPQLQTLYLKGSLRSLRYRGGLVSFRFKASSKYNPFGCEWFNLDDAMLDFRLDFGTGLLIHSSLHNPGFEQIFRSIKSVKYLTLHRWVFEEMVLSSLSGDSEFHFNYLTELWWIDCSLEIDNINALLNFLKLSPNLERLCVTIDPGSYKLTSTKKFSKRDDVGHIKPMQLEFVKLEGCRNEEEEILLARWLIPLFAKIPYIIAKSSDGNCFRLLEKEHKLEAEGDYPYRFKVDEHIHQICPDHVHMHL